MNPSEPLLGDVFGRAARVFDEVVVATGVNQAKQRLFTDDERLAMLRETVEPFGNVRVDTFDGLIVDYCRANDQTALAEFFESSTRATQATAP